MSRKRRMVIAISCILFGTIFLLRSMPLHRGPISDHYNGRTFYLSDSYHSIKDMIFWMITMKQIPWPTWVVDSTWEPPVQFVGGDTLMITHVNHATFLIQADSVNILTDPMWSDRAGPWSWFGVKRVRKPGISFDSLPPIHYILLSHNHYDHTDIPTLKKLWSRDQPHILCGLGMGKQLKRKGLRNFEELDWWDTSQIPSLDGSITFVPARHSSGRGLFDSNKTLWGGYVLDIASQRIYFSGDSGLGAHIDSIHQRFPVFDIALLPLGNYEARWFMKSQHMNPQDAVFIHQLFHVKQSIGMHFSTFAEHPEQSIDQHVLDLQLALEPMGINPATFIIPDFGERIEFINTQIE